MRSKKLTFPSYRKVRRPTTTNAAIIEILETEKVPWFPKDINMLFLAQSRLSLVK